MIIEMRPKRATFVMTSIELSRAELLPTCRDGVQQLLGGACGAGGNGKFLAI